MHEIKCKKCKVEMLELEMDPETMTDGQYSDYMAGFNHVFLCPKCGSQTVADGNSLFCDLPDWEAQFLSRYKLSLKSKQKVGLYPKEKLAKENIIRGDFNEYLMKKHYQRLGFDTVRIVSVLGKEHILNERELFQLCMVHNRQDVFCYLKALCMSSLAGLPDFLVLNQEECFFVECKASVDGIRDVQKKCHAFLIESGYSVKVFCTKIRLSSINYPNSSIYDVSLRKPPPN